MANYQYLTATGVIVPDTSTILAQVTAEYQGTFGSDLIVTPDSPAGLLITAETLSRTQEVQNNAAVANQINPQIAAGTFLDAIMALTGVQRTPAVQTFVPGVTLTGAAATVIPAGTIAATAAGDKFATTTSVMIGGGGTITADFKSLEFGPIPCTTSALTVVVTSILGWETVNNTVAGVLGSATQGDVGARAYRNNTLGFQGVALPTAIISALYNVPGISSVWFQENTAATTQVINSVSMVAHSVLAVVNGGTDIDVAAALLENKSTGSAWNGTTTVNIVEPTSGQTYPVKFTKATPVEVSIQVTTTNGNTANIKAAILAYMNGQVANFPLVFGSAWSIGGTLSAFEISAAISVQHPDYIITNVEISRTISPSFDTVPLVAGVTEIFFTTNSDIAVTVS